MNWDEKPELNVTPLVDVMLVLVAVLMLTTPIVLYEESIRVPTGSQQAPVGEQPSIDIRVDENRQIFVGKRQFEFDAFADSFLLYANQFPERNHKVLIHADERLSYADVMFILRSVKAARFSEIALVSDG